MFGKASCYFADSIVYCIMQDCLTAEDMYVLLDCQGSELCQQHHSQYTETTAFILISHRSAGCNIRRYCVPSFQYPSVRVNTMLYAGSDMSKWDLIIAQPV